MNATTETTTFEGAVRQLARREGFAVTDETPVVVDYSTSQTGYSEYTITSTWDNIQVRCGDFSRYYESRSQEWRGGVEYGAVNAFAALMADLHPESPMTTADATLVSHTGTPPWEALKEFEADPVQARGTYEFLFNLGKGEEGRRHYDRFSSGFLDVHGEWFD